MPGGRAPGHDDPLCNGVQHREGPAGAIPLDSVADFCQKPAKK